MLYQSEHGEIEQNLIQQARLAGEPLPDEIANKPKLANGNAFYWHAFLELDTERSHAFNLSKIPRSAIIAYANECEFDAEQTSDLVTIIRLVDAAHLEKLAAKREAERTKT